MVQSQMMHVVLPGAVWRSPQRAELAYLRAIGFKDREKTRQTAGGCHFCERIDDQAEHQRAAMMLVEGESST